MYFKAEQNEEGEYLRADGVRYLLQQCRRVRPADSWEEFPSLEECLTAWRLTYAPIETEEAPESVLS